MTYKNICIDQIKPKELKNNELSVFLPGFPGNYTKNDDLALKVCASYGSEIALISYKGLGRNSGTFSLSKVINEVSEFVENSGDRPINIFGYSFGGLSSLNAIEDNYNKINKIVLLSPLIILPEQQKLIQILKGAASLHNKLEGYNLDIEVLTQELDELHTLSENILSKTIPKLSSKTLIIHGTKDVVLNVDSSKKIIEINNNINFTELNCDHWFEDRTELANTVLAFLNE